ncbi:hypothetical protein [Streptomyces sp. 5-6(2022)]|uniref:hypothetical protein n=1 Tax=Streptomyces sp. 5-6(2022) TaxID=2936510 RepID=UPI0023B95E5D|nr:hypothetical protein [Streptomyces sp. 5-6(2022)]
MSLTAALALHILALLATGTAATWAIRRWHRRRWARQVARDIHALPTTTRERGNQ